MTSGVRFFFVLFDPVLPETDTSILSARTYKQQLICTYTSFSQAALSAAVCSFDFLFSRPSEDLCLMPCSALLHFALVKGLFVRQQRTQ